MTSRRVAMLAVGNELLDGRTLETNGSLVATACGERGMAVVERRIVPDEIDAIAAAIGELSDSCQWVIVSGGLGPTHDDVTREAIAAALNESLVHDPDIAAALTARLSGRGDMSANLRQAMRPPSSVVLANDVGTAPGLVASVGAATVVVLPGPPHELEPMLQAWLESLGPPEQRLIQRQVAAVGIPESTAGAAIESLRLDAAIRVGITARDGVITATLTASGHDDAAMKIAHRRIVEAWHPWSIAPDGQSLSEVIGEHLLARGESIAIAESCTAGLVTAALGDVPGASRWLCGGWVTYANEMKTTCLDVPAALLRSSGPGAVSQEVAIAMASGAASHAQATWGLSITGIAGPSGGTPQKPVGTVFIGLRGPGETSARQFCFPGGRAVVRQRSVVAALAMICFAISGEDPGPMTWEVVA